MFNRFTITIGIGALPSGWPSSPSPSTTPSPTTPTTASPPIETNQRALTAQLATEIAIVNDLRRALDLLARRLRRRAGAERRQLGQHRRGRARAGGSAMRAAALVLAARPPRRAAGSSRAAPTAATKRRAGLTAGAALHVPAGAHAPDSPPERRHGACSRLVARPSSIHRTGCDAHPAAGSCIQRPRTPSPTEPSPAAAAPAPGSAEDNGCTTPRSHRPAPRRTDGTGSRSPTPPASPPPPPDSSPAPPSRTEGTASRTPASTAPRNPPPRTARPHDAPARCADAASPSPARSPPDASSPAPHPAPESCR